MKLSKTRIEEEAKKRALKDASKVQIDSTAEGKSYLRARYLYHYKKLGGEEK